MNCTASRLSALIGTGPLTMAPTPVIAFGRSVGSTESTPDVQIHFGPWTAKSRETGWWGMSPFRVLDAYSAFTMTVCQLRPRSRGEVRLPPATVVADANDTRDSTESAANDATSADPADVLSALEPPLIYPNYLSDPYDLATAVGGLKLMRQVARSVSTPVALIWYCLRMRLHCICAGVTLPLYPAFVNYTSGPLAAL